MKPSEQRRNPTESEFFRKDDASSSLVGECIQNVLDSRFDLKSDEPVRVRFYLSDAKEMPGDWFENLGRHLEVAEGCDPEILIQKTRFMVIEDFGTTGLSGKIDAARESELEAGEKNDFYYFWRNVGRSGKVGSGLGSWGLGKSVLHDSSKINSFLGWSIRTCDNKSLLMGQAKLPIHELPEGDTSKQYDAYGFFADFGYDFDSGYDDEFAMPTEDPDTIEKFKLDFNIKRTVEPGLSIVIPYVLDDFKSEIDHRKLILSIIKTYVYPIIDGKLIVDVATSKSSVIINKDTVIDCLDDLKKKGDISDSETLRIEGFILLCEAVIGGNIETTCLKQKRRTVSDKWANINWPEETAEELRAQFNKNDYLRFKIPIHVRKKDTEPLESFFHVVLTKEKGFGKNKFHFNRQGLTLTEINNPQGTGVVGLVLIEDETLAKMMKDAENPAHTKWISSSKRLKSNFLGGPERVRFVTSSPMNILNMLYDTGVEADTELLSELFPDPDPEADSPGEIPKPRKRGRKKADPNPPPPKKPKQIGIVKSNGGFTISWKLNGVTPDEEKLLLVEAAFDCSIGNAFKNWSSYDFIFEDEDEFKIEICGGEVIERKDNKILIRLFNDDFQLQLFGFEEDRDVIVRHRWITK
jgi:hypothetical protein